ncbi:MAG TPA: mandelate racemase/muconate lactonizing enzyme family protein [Gaiella sp.]
MQIRRVDVYAVRYHHATGPFVMSGGRVSTEQDGTVVRLETDDGLVGWGEQCVITPTYAAGYAPTTQAVLRLLAPALLGADPRRTDVAYARLDGATKGYRYAKSALDMACWDLFGRATGLPLADLLGGIHAEEFPLYTGIGIASPEQMRERCAAALATGYRRVQLKVGTGVHEDVERIEACMEVLGDADLVIADANAWWTQPEAARVLAAVERLDVMIEQPCATLEECARLRGTTARPFVLDESLMELGDLVRARAAGAADAARLKLSRLGGITPTRRARDLAVSFGLPLTVEDAGGGDLVSATTAHFAASIPPRLLLGGYLPGEMAAERIATGTPEPDGGNARVPTGPGLGIDVNEDALGERLLRVE